MSELDRPLKQAREEDLEKEIEVIDTIESDFYAPILIRVLARLFPEKKLGEISVAVVLAYSEENNRGRE